MQSSTIYNSYFPCAPITFEYLFAKSLLHVHVFSSFQLLDHFLLCIFSPCLCYWIKCVFKVSQDDFLMKAVIPVYQMHPPSSFSHTNSYLTLVTQLPWYRNYLASSNAFKNHWIPKQLRFYCPVTDFFFSFVLVCPWIITRSWWLVQLSSSPVMNDPGRFSGEKLLHSLSWHSLCILNFYLRFLSEKLLKYRRKYHDSDRICSCPNIINHCCVICCKVLTSLIICF